MGGSANAGIGRYSFELLRSLLALNQAKLNEADTYTVFYHPENTQAADLEALQSLGAKLVAAKFRHYSLAEQIFFPRLLRRYDLDLMHFPNFNVPVFYSKPFVVTIHDMVHHKISGHKKSTYLKFLAYKWIIKRAAEKAVRIITVTQAAKKEIISFLNVPEPKISVTYEAPAQPLVVEQQYDFQKLKSLLQLNKPYLLFVGTLERKKNIVKLCQGFDRFLDKYKFDIDLVIAGKIDIHYPQIKQQALQIKHKDHLVFTGFVEDDMQAALYRHAHAFITASLHEGFGLPGLEAMQYGIPVLAANTEVFNEVYDNAAIFFDPLNIDDIADKINLLLRDIQFHQEMQKRSATRVAMFDWHTTALQTREIYQQAIYPEFKPEPEL